MSQLSEFAHRIASRPDPDWHADQIRTAITAYVQETPADRDPDRLERRLQSVTDRAEHHERGLHVQ